MCQMRPYKIKDIVSHEQKETVSIFIFYSKDTYNFLRKCKKFAVIVVPIVFMPRHITLNKTGVS